MAEEKNTPKRIHNLVVENRKKITISAVTDVDNFDEQMIVMYTELGQLSIKGENLHINTLSVESGDMEVEGTICALAYTDNTPNKGGFLSKLFR